MHSLQTFVSALSLLIFSAMAFAAPTAGKDYLEIKPAQPTDTSSKIEVVEVFSYMCPHCHEFDPKVSAWVKQLPADVQFRRMPVVFGRASWETMARSYYALEALGEIERIHPKIFAAMHDDNIILQQRPILIEWMEKQGVDPKKFGAAYDSFSMGGKIQRSNQRAQSYGITGVPSMVIDGKYMVSTKEAGNYDNMLKIASELVKMVQASKGSALKSAPVKAAQK